jgi:hypothetical protein
MSDRFHEHAGKKTGPHSSFNLFVYPGISFFAEKYRNKNVELKYTKSIYFCENTIHENIIPEAR